MELNFLMWTLGDTVKKMVQWLNWFYAYIDSIRDLKKKKKKKKGQMFSEYAQVYYKNQLPRAFT